jgi:hypothetical protein
MGNKKSVKHAKNIKYIQNVIAYQSEAFYGCQIQMKISYISFFHSDVKVQGRTYNILK